MAVKNSETSDSNVERRDRVNIVGLDVDVTDIEETLRSLERLSRRGGGYVCFANVHMVMEACDHPDFREIVNSADLVLPDGRPLVWMQKLLGRENPQGVRAKDLMVGALRHANANRSRVGFYGSTPAVLDEIRERIMTDFPDLSVSYMYSPPFRPPSDAEDREIVENINAAAPELLFVGLGCPKQEFWMARHRGRLSCTMLGVGAAFDFYAGTVRESPKWLSDIGLEWLFRLAKEPRRLFQRYWSTNPRFVILAARQLLRRR